MRKSSNYNLNLAEGSDVVNPLVVDVPNYEIIDETMKDNANSGITTATELLTGTVHALTRVNKDAPMFRFVATSNFKVGETFTVDGEQVTALMSTGEPLGNGAYVINSNVLCCLTGTLLTVFTCMGGEYVAYDSNRLGGKPANEYATNERVEDAIELAQAANAVTNAVANRYIVEHGSNTRGKWIQWSDGTLELFGKCDIGNVKTDKIGGSLYNSGTMSFTMPKHSLTPVDVIGLSANTGGHVWASAIYSGEMRDVVYFILFSPYNTTEIPAGRLLCYHALGTWK